MPLETTGGVTNSENTVSITCCRLWNNQLARVGRSQVTWHFVAPFVTTYKVAQKQGTSICSSKHKYRHAVKHTCESSSCQLYRYIDVSYKTRCQFHCSSYRVVTKLSGNDDVQINIWNLILGRIITRRYTILGI